MSWISLFANSRSRSTSNVFSTLPRSGRIAWYCLSRASFADPPAESPSTRNTSRRDTSSDSQSVSLPGSTATPEPFLLLDLLRRLHPRHRLLDRELGDPLAVLDVRVEPHLERILHDLRDELQRIAAGQLLLDLALELRVEDARRQHEAHVRRHVLGLQSRAARQQAVMIDECLDRFEQRRAQARLVRSAGGRRESG